MVEKEAATALAEPAALEAEAPGEEATGEPAGAAGDRKEKRVELRARELRQSVRELRREKKELARNLAEATARADAAERAALQLQTRINLLAQARLTPRSGERLRLLMAALFTAWRESPAAAEKGGADSDA